MGQVSKKAKEQILKMMLQEVSTEDIAKRLHFAIGTVRNVFQELRQEYEVNSKLGIAKAYLFERIQKAAAEIQAISDLCDTTCQIAGCSKEFRSVEKEQKNKKNKF